MSHGEKYSILLMRDDGRTFRWRVSLFFFRTLCCIIVLLPLLLGGAGWLAWTLYKGNVAINIQLQQLEQENTTLSSVLTRLSNLERLLNMPDGVKQLALQSQQSMLKAEALNALPPAIPHQSNIDDQNQEDAISLEAGESPQFSAAPDVDMRLVGVENVFARRVGNSLRVTLDLINTQQKNQLGGYVSCAIKGTDGTKFLLEIPRDVAAFRINRFKRAVLAPVLPEAVRGLPALTLVIEVHLEDRGVVYRSEYPVEQSP